MMAGRPKWTELAGLLGAVAFAAVVPAVAQTSQPSEAEGGQTPFYWLRVTADRVNLRSRADLNSRIVARVERDDLLKGVGKEYGWYRVIPPPGVYSVVSADYIERVSPDRGIVRVTTSLRVRAGSDIQPLDPLLSEVQTRLGPDSEVEIIGELSERWLKIKPPPGVYVYVAEDYVERISEQEAAALREARAKAPPVATVAATQPVPTTQAASQPAAVRTTSAPTMPTSAPAVPGARPTPKPPQAVRKPVATMPAEPVVVIVGLLEPCYDLRAGQYGMRYQIMSTDRRHVLAYVEFPPKLGFEAPREVGKYVRIEGVWRRRPHVNVRIIEARKATVLSMQPTWRPRPRRDR